MTTKEIEKRLTAQEKEINKLKSYVTRLANKLVENKIEVPVTNWAKELDKED